jgi:sulfur carrier protein
VEGGTAHDLLVAIGLDGRPVAVEVNEVVVPRASLPERVLRQDDQLEIVTLVGGG